MLSRSKELCFAANAFAAKYTDSQQNEILFEKIWQWW